MNFREIPNESEIEQRRVKARMKAEERRLEKEELEWVAALWFVGYESHNLWFIGYDFQY